MAYDKGIRERKNMAMGNGPMPGGNFGSEDLSTRSMAHPDAKGGSDHAVAKDGDRAAAMPVMHTKGKLPAQANPDHGKH
jgi:hypothetical protein